MENEFDFSLKWMLFLVSDTCEVKIFYIFILSVSNKNRLPKASILKGLIVKQLAFLLIDFYEESITYRYETALWCTAVKNFGQYIFLWSSN